MDNYEYIIASLPVLTQDMRDSNGPDPKSLVLWIRSQCSARDNALIDILEEGFDQDRLGDGFYAKALASRNSFIRDYFSYDLMMRNEKVKWLNKALGLLLGIVVTLLILGVIIVMFDTINLKYGLVSETALSESIMYNSIKDLAYTVFPYLKELLMKQ